MRHPRLFIHDDLVSLGVPMYHVALVRDEGVPKVAQSISVSEPSDAARVCEDLRYKPQEHFCVLCLSTKNLLLARVPISIGTLNTTIVSPREVYKAALAANACSIVVVHNHPSGDPASSVADKRLAKHLADAGSILDIELLDFIIIGDAESVVSLREDGVL